MKLFIAMILVLTTVLSPVATTGNCSAARQKSACCPNCDTVALAGNCCCGGGESSSSLNLENVLTAPVSPGLLETEGSVPLSSVLANSTWLETRQISASHTPLFLLLGSFLS
jgi:hypothetical protein